MQIIQMKTIDWIPIRKALNARGLAAYDWLMNPVTGSVDRAYIWASEMKDWEGDQQEQWKSLVHVVKDGAGDWVEA